MSPEPLNEREFELINIIGRRLGSNQRDLSSHLNLSLGQTNMLSAGWYPRDLSASAS